MRQSTGVLDLVLQLIDKSLVLPDVGGADGDAEVADRPVEPTEDRYRMPETLREYARERLQATGRETEQVRRRHLDYFLKHVEAAGTDGPSGAALRRLARERDNLWAALRGAREQDDAGAERRLAVALSRLVRDGSTPAVRRALAPLLSEVRRLESPAHTAVRLRLLQESDLRVLQAGADVFSVIGDYDTEDAVADRLRTVAQTAGRDTPAGARALLRVARVLLVRGSVAEGLALLTEASRVAEANGDDALLLDVRLEEGYALTHTADCPRGRSAFEASLTLLERLRSLIGDNEYRARRLLVLRGRGCVEHNADDTAACAASHRAALVLARETGDAEQETRALLNLADAWWGCWEYGRALEEYDRALRAATDAGYERGRAGCLVGRGIVLWAAGQTAEAGDVLQEGLALFRELGNAWWIAYGLAYRGAIEADRGDLAAALATSREAIAVAGRHGVGYPLVLARAHALWQQEALTPGRPEHRVEIVDALGDAERLGLHGLALSLRWVRLLHRVADPRVPDADIARAIADAVEEVRAHAPTKGAWELQGRQLSAAVRRHRPSLAAAALPGLEGVIDAVIRRKAESLDPRDRRAYRETRLAWGDRGTGDGESGSVSR